MLIYVLKKNNKEEEVILEEYDAAYFFTQHPQRRLKENEIGHVVVEICPASSEA